MYLYHGNYIKDFQRDFPTDDVCLDYIFEKKYGKDFVCKCGKFDCFYKVTGRKKYACSWCGWQIAPTSGTIFHKSPTSLTSWFYAIFQFSASKNGVSAKELERQIGVTYKCAWRMAKQIRELMTQGGDMLSGVVEADETYVGGKGGNNKRGRGAENKTPVFGMVERQGEVRAEVVGNVKMSTVMPLIKENIKIESNLMTDEYNIYKRTGKAGYNHQVIQHGIKEYVRGDVHTNTIEGFWSQLKRSVTGTYHFVSPKYLQSYVNEFAWKYNHRNPDLRVFDCLMARI